METRWSVYSVFIMHFTALFFLKAWSCNPTDLTDEKAKCLVFYRIQFLFLWKFLLETQSDDYISLVKNLKVAVRMWRVWVLLFGGHNELFNRKGLYSIVFIIIWCRLTEIRIAPKSNQLRILGKLHSSISYERWSSFTNNWEEFCSLKFSSNSASWGKKRPIFLACNRKIINISPEVCWHLCFLSKWI